MTFPQHEHETGKHISNTEETQQFTPLESPTFATSAPPAPPSKKHHLVWLWILLGVIIIAAGACFGTAMYYQHRALPGTSLWGHNVSGKTAEQISQEITDQVNNTEIPVSYDGKTVEISAQDLGIQVDAQAIGQQLVDAKRNESIFQRYWPWSHVNLDPQIDVTQDTTALDTALGTQTVQAQDAQLVVDEEGSHVTVTPAVVGSGADPTDTINEAVNVIKSLGDTAAQTVTISLKDINPTVTDDVANQAKDTINSLIDNKVGISVDGEEIAQFDADTLLKASHIDPDTESTLPENEARNGVVVFDADALQDAYENTIKPSLKNTREDRDVVVNGNGEVTEVISEGHDGVTITEGSDTNVGQDALSVLQKGSGTVELEGTVDKMKTKETKKHVVVDLSDHKVYAYENDKLVKSMNMSAGQGNDYATGACNPSGDMCTPLGDFDIWLKYPTQDMSGTLELSDGTKETWDVKGVKYVNYFSKSGCAIHRIATSTEYTDADIAAMARNTSHGCVGIGWDVAEWFYNWCGMGTSVHVQQ